jgi:hypothetical protein
MGAVTAALDAVPEAYHNPAVVWRGVFAPSVVIRDQACPVDHGTGSRSQIRIDATSTVPWYMNSRLS